MPLDSKKPRAPKGSRGMTLIEVIVSVALLAIVSVMIITAMSSSLNALSITRRRTNAAMSAAGNIESRRAAGDVSGADSSIIINISGVPYQINGQIVSNTQNSVTYKEFIPDSK